MQIRRSYQAKQDASYHATQVLMSKEGVGNGVNKTCRLSKKLRSIPAAESEQRALFGLDPTHLAQLALKDAKRAVSLVPQSPAALCQQVHCFSVTQTSSRHSQVYCFSLERHSA